MPRDLSIRRYRPEDAAPVWTVHEAAFRASPLAFVEDADADRDIHEIEAHYLDADGEFLVGEVDDPENVDQAIVATGGYVPLDDRRVEIKRMRVHPEYQRRGFARAILDELEGRARDAGHEHAELETVAPLEAAQAFYEDAGYEVVDEWADERTGVATYQYRKSL